MIQYSYNLPSKMDSSCIIFIDKKLTALPQVKPWLEQFAFVIKLDAGEDLKTLLSLQRVLNKLMALKISGSAQDLTFLAVGGGSITDFVGFVASIYKRGVRLIHIPSTWLAAVDSSHGGKTALNVGKYKNQIGTFYPAEKIIIVKSLLKQQPKMREYEALGEVYKAGLLSGGQLYKTVFAAGKGDIDIWPMLPRLIAVKNKIVKADPFEKKGMRKLLNLGHSTAHVLELEKSMPHGLAVWYGLVVAIELSVIRNLLSEKEGAEIKKLLCLKMPIQKRIKLKYKVIQAALMKDKKIGRSLKLSEPLIFAPGKVKLVDVTISELINAMGSSGVIDVI